MSVAQKSKNHQRVLHRIADLFLSNLVDTEYKIMKWYCALPMEAQVELIGYYGESPHKIVHGLIADGTEEAGMQFAGYQPVRHTDSKRELKYEELPTITSLRAVQKDALHAPELRVAENDD